MPFTLAHPAAVLPLRRYCPRLLSFPALVLGSVAPDVGYLFGMLHADEFSHGWIGSVVFGMPVGALMLCVLYGLRSMTVGFLPERCREPFLQACRKPPSSPLAIAVSLVIGIWTHIAWDSFTHRDGWLVERLAMLQYPIAPVAGHWVRVCHVLWYVCTFAGVAWLCLAFQRWEESVASAPAPGPHWARTRDALLCAALVVPVAATHHLVRNAFGTCLVAAAAMLIVIVFALHTACRAR